MDPASIPFAALGKGALKGVKGLKTAKEWRAEVGRLVHAGLCRALCFDDPANPAARDAAGVIGAELADVIVTGGEQPSRTTRWRRKVRRLVSGQDIKQLIAPIGPTFEEHLQGWVRVVVDRSPRAADALASVKCPGAHGKNVETFSQAFPKAFLVELLSWEPEPRSRTVQLALINDVLAAEELRFQAGHVRARAWAQLISVSGAGAAGFAVTAEALGNPSSLEQVGAGSLGAVATGIVAQRVRRARQRRSAPRLLLDDIVRSWIAELLGYLLGHRVDATTGSLTEGVKEAMGREPHEKLADPRQPAESSLARNAPSHLARDLSDRLIVRAGACDDEDLVAALWRLEDALVRWAHSESADRRLAIYAPLIEILDAMELAPTEADQS